jgi:uncharacterized protein YndB with AHSA1/START domain
MTDVSFIPELTTRELLTTREVNFPIALVFEAFVNPDHCKNWWGPNGFTNTFHEFRAEPYGAWKFIMHGPDGKDYENDSQFLVVQKPSCVVLDHLNAPEFRAVFRFEPVSESSTRINWRMIFKTQELHDALIGFVTGKNEENLDRLEAELGRMQQK